MAHTQAKTNTHGQQDGKPGQQDSMHIDKQGKIVETAREARGAEPGPTMRNVLVLSISLVVVAFVVVYAVFMAG